MKAFRLVSAAILLVGALTWSAWGHPALADEFQVGGADEFQVQIGEVEHVVHDLAPVGTTGIQGPDLVIDKVWMASGCVDTTPANGSSLADGFLVNFTVRNAGTAKVAKTFDVKIRVIERNDAGKVYRGFHDMAPGHVFTSGEYFLQPTGMVSRVHVAVTVDAKNEVTELKESNNSTTVELTNPCVQSFPSGG